MSTILFGPETGFVMGTGEPEATVAGGTPPDNGTGIEGGAGLFKRIMASMVREVIEMREIKSERGQRG